MPRRPRIFKDLCKGCGYCVEFCPKKVLGWSDDLNRFGVHYAVVKNPGACVGCGLCERLCPDLAIILVEEKA